MIQKSQLRGETPSEAPLTPKQEEQAEDTSVRNPIINQLIAIVSKKGLAPFEKYGNQISAELFQQILEHEYRIAVEQRTMQQIQQLLQDQGTVQNGMRFLPLDTIRELLDDGVRAYNKQQAQNSTGKGESVGAGANVEVKQTVMEGLAIRTRDKILQAFGKDIQTMIQHFYPYDKAIVMLDMPRWIVAVRAIDPQISQRDAENLFRWCDANNSGLVTLVEFKHHFLTAEQRIKRDRESVRLPAHMLSDIDKLFRQVDLDKSGFLDFNELKMVLGKFGVNVGAEQMRDYIRRFDRNGDGLISPEEFRIIVEERIISEMLDVEDFVEELRIEYTKQGSKYINLQQLHQLCKNLGAVNITPEESAALFSEVDQKRTGRINLDDLTRYLLDHNQDHFRGLAASAVVSLCTSRSLSLQDLRSIFEGLPQHFRTSWVRAQLKHGLFWPATPLKPTLVSDSARIYRGLEVVFDAVIDVESESLLDRTKYAQQNQTFISITLQTADGVPIPAGSQAGRDQLLHREAYVGIFDLSFGSLVGNVVRVKAEWNSQQEKQWTFPKDNEVLLKLTDFSAQKSLNLNLYVELIVHYSQRPKNNRQQQQGTSQARNQQQQQQTVTQELEISCSYAMLPLSQLFEIKTGTTIGRTGLSKQGLQVALSKNFEVQMQGGEPEKPLEIDARHTQEEGLFGQIQSRPSTLSIKVRGLDMNSKTANDTNICEQLLVLPELIVLNSYSLEFFCAFREYFAYRAYTAQRSTQANSNLATDLICKNFLRVINCPQTAQEISLLWRDKVLPSISATKKMQDVYKKFEYLITQCYLMFSSRAFRFLQADQTAANYSTPLHKQRMAMTEEIVRDVKNYIAGGGAARGAKSFSQVRTEQNPLPFRLQEVMEEDEEEQLLMLERYAQRKGERVEVGQTEQAFDQATQ